MPGLVNLIGLQDELCDEVRRLLSNVITVNAYGEEVRGFSVYAQQLPKVRSDPPAPGEDPDAQFFPYALVICDSRETDTVADPWSVNMQILLALYDDHDDNQGHRKLVPMMERVADRFLRRPLLGRYWTAKPDIRQALQTSDYWPYFFGLTEITFDMFKQVREDPLDDGYIIQKVRTDGSFSASADGSC